MSRTTLLLFPLASAANEWQYFCFDSAAQFGRLSKNTIFSVLPDPSGRQSAMQPPAAPSLPEPVVAPEEPAGADASPFESAQAALKNIAEACYFMRVGYWTYEVCPFRRVRQYHSETAAVNGGSAIHDEFSLGVHIAGQDEWRATQSLYTQQFADGTEGRSTAVRYTCPDSWRDEDGIVVVHEPKPKHYVITMRVQALCTKPKASRRMVTAGVKNTPAKQAESKTSGVSSQATTKLKTPSAAAHEASADADGKAEKGPMQIAELVLPNTRLLSSIRGRCFSMMRDYWTYEFCPMQHVRQYRSEGNRISIEFKLGTYDKMLDKVTVGVRGTLDKHLIPHTFAQQYNNGTSNRKAQVRVRCAEKNEHSLIAVDEPQMHEYVLLFSSPLACELSCAYAYAPSDE